jgi:hypothetical protein
LINFVRANACGIIAEVKIDVDFQVLHITNRWLTLRGQIFATFQVFNQARSKILQDFNFENIKLYLSITIVTA